MSRLLGELLDSALRGLVGREEALNPQRFQRDVLRRPPSGNGRHKAYPYRVLLERQEEQWDCSNGEVGDAPLAWHTRIRQQFLDSVYRTAPRQSPRHLPVQALDELPGQGIPVHDKGGLMKINGNRAAPQGRLPGHIAASLP